jgi:hypothetical protein
MENLEKKLTVNLVLRKVFDIKLKPGHDVKRAHLDEVIYLFNNLTE